jgi:Flp pilus assembly protein TadG
LKIVRRNGKRGEEAQGVIEFAILASVLLLLFLGTVDFARFMYYSSALNNAASAGAQVETSGGAINRSLAGTLYSAVTDNYALQASVCEGRPYVNLTPYPTGAGYDFCAACLSSSATCNNNDPCQVTAGTNSCGSLCSSSGDVCICRPDTSCPPSGATPSTGQKVVVTVGYKFVPITPLIRQFFPAQSCWSGDSTSLAGHTICAQAVGRVY